MTQNARLALWVPTTAPPDVKDMIVTNGIPAAGKPIATKFEAPGTGSGSGVPSDVDPLMDGVAVPGVGTTYSRGDHVHPTDTSRAPEASSDGTLYGRKNAAWVAVPTPASPSNNDPGMDGVAAAGSAQTYSRSDHIHPSDTGKAPLTHTHAQSDVTNLTSDLALKAPLASPTFTGDPKAPTPAPGDNDTSIATTAFVTGAVTSADNPSNALPAMDGTAAPGAATTYSRSDHVHPTDTTRAPLASPTFTGDPKAPTPAPGDNDTSIATTAFVATALANGAAVYVSDTPPAGAPDKSLWWESDSGVLFVRYNDGNTAQWVVASPQPDFTSLAPIASPTFTGDPKAPTPAAGDNDTSIATTAFVKSAIPYDALAYNGIQINGGMEVSQENGVSGVNVGTGTTKYIVDGWQLSSLGSQAVVGVKNPSGHPTIPWSLYCGVSVGNPSPPAASFTMFTHSIEGYRTARLAWGTTSASPITIGFWVAAGKAGTASGAIRNGAGNRSYTFTFPINAESTWEYKTITIPGDTAGTWAKDNTIGLTLTICQLVGSDYGAAAGTWTAGNFIGVAGGTNYVSSTLDGFQITGVTILPGTLTLTAAQSSLLMRPYVDELRTCQRYYNVDALWGTATRYYYMPTNGVFSIPAQWPAMRVAPTVGMTSAFSGIYRGQDGQFVIGTTVTGGQGTYYPSETTDITPTGAKLAFAAPVSVGTTIGGLGFCYANPYRDARL